MITSNAAFEEALEEAIAYLDNPPRAGSGDEMRFFELLSDIEDYRPTIVRQSQAAEPSKADKLAARAAELRARIERETQSAWYLRMSSGFEGIGNSVTGTARPY